MTVDVSDYDIEATDADQAMEIFTELVADDWESYAQGTTDFNVEDVDAEPVLALCEEPSPPRKGWVRFRHRHRATGRAHRARTAQNRSLIRASSSSLASSTIN